MVFIFPAEQAEHIPAAKDFVRIAIFPLGVVNDIVVSFIHLRRVAETFKGEKQRVQILFTAELPSLQQHAFFQQIVAVHEVYILSTGNGKPPVSGVGKSPVFLGYYGHVGKPLLIVLKDLPGPVGGTVIDTDHFHPGQRLLQQHAVQTRSNVIFVIVNRYDHRDRYLAFHIDLLVKVISPRPGMP